MPAHVQEILIGTRTDGTACDMLKDLFDGTECECTVHGVSPQSVAVAYWFSNFGLSDLMHCTL